MSERRQRYLITGANGQDGAYLVARLLAEGHEVHGMCHSEVGAELLVHESPAVAAHVADLRDDEAIKALVTEVRPTRLVNLAGNTSVARSWDAPSDSADVLGVGPVRMFDAAWRLFRDGHEIRVLQASSAEIFGDAIEVPQIETTPRRPATPYGAAKAFAHEMAGIYRARGMFVSTAILYNHESPRRPETFVARKIAIAVARISRGLQRTLVLGNIDVERDWGYAPDYVDAMLRILDQPESSDYIVATGSSHTVRQFVALAFEVVGISDWEPYVEIDPELYRPADPQKLVGDPSRLREIGWTPSVDFTELVRTMVAAELESLDTPEE